MANRVLNIHSEPEIRMALEVGDSNYNTNGYDIESIQIGDMVSVYGDTQENSTLNTLVLQVVRFEYYPDTMKIISSSIPPDVNKRIEDIERNLESWQTKDNASTPS